MEVELNLKEGRYYWRRDGKRVGPVVNTGSAFCPWQAMRLSWDRYGTWEPRCRPVHPYDLIAPAPPPLPEGMTLPEEGLVYCGMVGTFETDGRMFYGWVSNYKFPKWRSLNSWRGNDPTGHYAVPADSPIVALNGWVLEPPGSGAVSGPDDGYVPTGFKFEPTPPTQPDHKRDLKLRKQDAEIHALFEFLEDYKDKWTWDGRELTFRQRDGRHEYIRSFRRGSFWDMVKKLEEELG